MILCAKKDVIPELKVPAIGDVTTIPHESSIKLGTFGEITFYLSQRSAKATASDRLSLFHMISQQHEKPDKKTEVIENMMMETESIDLGVFADGSVRQLPTPPEDDKAGDDDAVEAAPDDAVEAALEQPPAKKSRKGQGKKSAKAKAQAKALQQPSACSANLWRDGSDGSVGTFQITIPYMKMNPAALILPDDTSCVKLTVKKKKPQRDTQQTSTLQVDQNPHSTRAVIAKYMKKPPNQSGKTKPDQQDKALKHLAL